MSNYDGVWPPPKLVDPQDAALNAAYERGMAVGVAAGRKQAAAEIRAEIEAAKPSVRRFWDTTDAARVYALNDAAKIAARIAEESNHAN